MNGPVWAGTDNDDSYSRLILGLRCCVEACTRPLKIEFCDLDFIIILIK